MDDDLNISPALAVIFDFVNEINSLLADKKISKKQADNCLNLVRAFNSVLGVIEEKSEEIPKEAKKLIQEREAARKSKDWKKSDEIRDKLDKMGIVVMDSPEGPKWFRK